MRRHSLLLCLLLLLGTSMVAAAQDAPCLLVDSDGGLDDVRAVALLVAQRQRVVAIVMTEGQAAPPAAVRAFQNVFPNIPVIEGGSPPPLRRLLLDLGELRTQRQAAETLNGTLPHEAGPEPPLATRVAEATAQCERITLLAIGPWTSFLEYEPRLRGRLTRIVAQGSPLLDDEARGLPAGWNCNYHRDACLEAAGRLALERLRVEWVDIPNGKTACGTAQPGWDAAGHRDFAYAPTTAMAEALASSASPLAQRMGRIMQHDPTTWSRTSLWDDLAALYLLQPALFGNVPVEGGARGGHLEPCRPPDDIRAALVAGLQGQPL